MQFKKTWVLVANGAVARIFSFTKGKLTELTVLTHPETRMHGHDLVTDKPGTSFGSNGFGRYAMEQHTLPQKNEAEHFAKEVAKHIDLHHRKDEFQHLHIIAAPAFLGLLRHSLHAETQKSILTEVDKDLVDESPLHIRSYLP